MAGYLDATVAAAQRTVRRRRARSGRVVGDARATVAAAQCPVPVDRARTNCSLGRTGSVVTAAQHPARPRLCRDGLGCLLAIRLDGRISDLAGAIRLLATSPGADLGAGPLPETGEAPTDAAARAAVVAPPSDPDPWPAAGSGPRGTFGAEAGSLPGRPRCDVPVVGPRGKDRRGLVRIQAPRLVIEGLPLARRSRINPARPLAEAPQERRPGGAQATAHADKRDGEREQEDDQQHRQYGRHPCVVGDERRSGGPPGRWRYGGFGGVSPAQIGCDSRRDRWWRVHLCRCRSGDNRGCDGRWRDGRRHCGGGCRTRRFRVHGARRERSCRGNRRGDRSRATCYRRWRRRRDGRRWLGRWARGGLGGCSDLLRGSRRRSRTVLRWRGLGGTGRWRLRGQWRSVHPGGRAGGSGSRNRHRRRRDVRSWGLMPTPAHGRVRLVPIVVVVRRRTPPPSHAARDRRLHIVVVVRLTPFPPGHATGDRRTTGMGILAAGRTEGGDAALAGGGGLIRAGAGAGFTLAGGRAGGGAFGGLEEQLLHNTCSLIG